MVARADDRAGVWRLADGDLERLMSGGSAAYLADLALLTGRAPEKAKADAKAPKN